MIWITDEYNPNKKHKRLLIFNGMIADMLSNDKINLKAIQLFKRVRKRNISRFYHIILFCYLIIHQILTLDFRNFYKKYIGKPYYFLFIDASLYIR